MEWKKEKMSASELEKKQKEYINAALGMMKRSHTDLSAQEPAPVPAPEPPEETPVTVSEKPDVTEEKPEPENTEAAAPEADKNEPETPETPVTKTADDNDSTTFGVYTADELLNGEYKDDGLKKAAEILEEMTRSTAYMKKLADGDGGETENDPDTTDFPDFSCDIGDEGENSFREEEKTNESEENGNG